MSGAKLVLLVLPLACALRAPVAPLRAGLMAPPRPALAMRSSLHMGLSPDESSTKETALDPTCIEDEAVEECQLVSWDAGSITIPMSWVETAKLGVLFTAWFALNVMYNITNKRVQARRSDRWPRSAPARSRAIRSDRPPPAERLSDAVDDGRRLPLRGHPVGPRTLGHRHPQGAEDPAQIKRRMKRRD